MWPYHAALRAKLGLKRLVSAEPTWNAVADDLYIGGWWAWEGLGLACLEGVVLLGQPASGQTEGGLRGGSGW